MSARRSLLLAPLAAALWAGAAEAQSAGIAAPGECAAPLRELELQPVAQPSGGEAPAEEPPTVGGVPGDLFETPVLSASSASLSLSDALDPRAAAAGLGVAPPGDGDGPGGGIDLRDPIEPLLDPVLDADLLGAGG